MGLLAMLAVFVTSATVVIYGEAIWDPVTLSSKMTGIVVLIALIILLVDTISVNLAANLVGPAYDFAAMSPRKISYKVGACMTAIIGVVMMPWKILESTHGLIFVWLGGYSSLLGAIAGILITDYYLIRKTVLSVDDLYKRKGIYTYNKGWNKVAVVAFLAGVLPNLPGFLNAAGFLQNIDPMFINIYSYAWFVGFFIAAIVYYVGMATAARKK